MGLMKWIIIGTATVVAGPLVLPLLLGGNMDGIDGYDDDCWKNEKIYDEITTTYLKQIKNLALYQL